MVDINKSLDEAKDDGVLTAEAHQALQLVDLGNIIQDNLGVTPEDIDSNEVFAFLTILDDSWSIEECNNTKSIRTGYNRILSALRGSQNRDDIITMTGLMNGGALSPPLPLVDTPDLKKSQYQPDGGTPLYDSIITACKIGLAKWKEFTDEGSDFRGLIFLLSDGEDTWSSTIAEQAKAAVTNLLDKELFSFIAMGVKNPRINSFQTIFEEVGIPQEWILEVDDDEHSIREACGIVSRASAAASQTGGLSQYGGITDFDD